MKREVFQDGGFLWQNFQPFHVLTLRAVAPAAVFTAETKRTYLDLVGNEPELTGIADIAFADDYSFAKGLAEDIRPPIVALMKMAYTAGIRPGDARVRNM